MHPTYSMMSSHGTSFAAHDGAQHHNLHPSHSQQHRQVLPPPPPGLGGDQQHYQQPMLSTRSAAHPSHPACFQPQVSLQQLADAAAKKDATVAAAAAKKKTPMKKKPAQKAASSSKTDPGVSRSTTDSTVDQSSDPHRANVHNPNNPLYWSSRGMAVPADLNAAAAEVGTIALIWGSCISGGYVGRRRWVDKNTGGRAVVHSGVCMKIRGYVM